MQREVLNRDAAEARLFADLELARRLEGADAAKYADYAHARPYVVPELNPAALPIAGGLAVYAGANSPYTRAIGLGLHGPIAEAEFARVDAFYRGHGMPGRISFCPLADRSLLELLNRHGYHAEMFMNVWYRPLRSHEPAPAPTAGLVLRPIRTDEADLWVRVAFSGGLDSDDAQPDRTAIIAAYPHMTHTQCYLAWLDGEAAAASTLAIHGPTASLFGTSTRPRFRNHGLQRALIDVRLADAARSGCDLAMVHTDPGSLSQRNVERVGFQLAYTKVMMRRE